MKCRAQAAAMARQAHGAINTLLRVQAARQKRDANSETRDRAAWTEHCALKMMKETLAPKAITEPTRTIDFSRCAEKLDSRSEPPQGPTPAPEPQEEPQPAPLATAELDEWALMQALDDWPGYGITTAPSKARARLGSALDAPPERDLAEAPTDAALQPPAATPVPQPAEPAPS